MPVPRQSPPPGRPSSSSWPGPGAGETEPGSVPATDQAESSLTGGSVPSPSESVTRSAGPGRVRGPEPFKACHEPCAGAAGDRDSSGRRAGPSRRGPAAAAGHVDSLAAWHGMPVTRSFAGVRVGPEASGRVRVRVGHWPAAGSGWLPVGSACRRRLLLTESVTARQWAVSNGGPAGCGLSRGPSPGRARVTVTVTVRDQAASQAGPGTDPPGRDWPREPGRSDLASSESLSGSLKRSDLA
jgi:hypothetical protein